MATMVVLVESGSATLPLEVRAVADLARLGVTHISLVGDEQTVGVVLDGWAFEPVASGAAAVAALGADATRSRILFPVGEMALDARGARTPYQTEKRSDMNTRIAALAALAVAVVVAPAAGASQAAGSAAALAVDAAFASAYQFGPFCPPGTAPGIECVRFVGTADVPGLGKATSTYVKTFDPVCPPDLPVLGFRNAVIDVAGKGSIQLSFGGTHCGPPAPAVTGPLALTVTGGSGIYAGATGSIRFSSSVHAPRGRCGVNLCGSASDAWSGSLTVPGLDFDLTPPTLRERSHARYAPPGRPSARACASRSRARTRSTAQCPWRASRAPARCSGSGGRA